MDTMSSSLNSYVHTDACQSSYTTNTTSILENLLLFKESDIPKPPKQTPVFFENNELVEAIDAQVEAAVKNFEHKYESKPRDNEPKEELVPDELLKPAIQSSICYGSPTFSPSSSVASENIVCTEVEEGFKDAFYWTKSKNTNNEGLVTSNFESTRRTRTTYSRSQHVELEKEYHTNNYVTKEQRLRIAKAVNLTERQVKLWFQNRRMKAKKAGQHPINNSLNNNKTEPNDVLPNINQQYFHGAVMQPIINYPQYQPPAESSLNQQHHPDPSLQKQEQLEHLNVTRSTSPPDAEFIIWCRNQRMEAEKEAQIRTNNYLNYCKNNPKGALSNQTPLYEAGTQMYVNYPQHHSQAQQTKTNVQQQDQPQINTQLAHNFQLSPQQDTQPSLQLPRPHEPQPQFSLQQQDPNQLLQYHHQLQQQYQQQQHQQYQQLHQFQLHHEQFQHHQHQHLLQQQYQQQHQSQDYLNSGCYRGYYQQRLI